MAAPTSFADLVASTLNELGPYDAVQQIAQEKQDYEVLPRWFKQDKIELGSGVAIQRSLMVANNGAARHAAPTAVDQVNLADVLKNITVQWVHADTSWMVIYQHALMNRDPSAILNQIKAQRTAAMLSLHEEMENKAWGDAPASTNTDDPWGIKYWIVKNATEGFTGGSPTGDNLIAGLNLTTLPTAGHYKNWSNTYTAITPTDLMPKWRKMHRQTRFRSPVDMKDYMTGSGDDYRYYTNDAGIAGIEEVLAAQADLSIRDVYSVDGMSATFKGNPIRWIAALDSDTSNPVYAVNHSVFQPVCLKGDNLRETRNMAPRNHNIEQYFVDLSYNFLCVDRRRCGVLYVA